MDTSSSSKVDTGQGCPASGPEAPWLPARPSPGTIGLGTGLDAPKNQGSSSDCAGSEKLAPGEGGGDSLPVRGGIHEW